MLAYLIHSALERCDLFTTINETFLVWMVGRRCSNKEHVIEAYYKLTEAGLIYRQYEEDVEVTYPSVNLCTPWKKGIITIQNSQVLKVLEFNSLPEKQSVLN